MFHVRRASLRADRPLQRRTGPAGRLRRHHKADPPPFGQLAAQVPSGRQNNDDHEEYESNTEA